MNANSSFTGSRAVGADCSAQMAPKLSKEAQAKVDDVMAALQAKGLLAAAKNDSAPVPTRKRSKSRPDEDAESSNKRVAVSTPATAVVENSQPSKPAVEESKAEKSRPSKPAVEKSEPSKPEKSGPSKPEKSGPSKPEKSGPSKPEKSKPAKRSKQSKPAGTVTVNRDEMETQEFDVPEDPAVSKAAPLYDTMLEEYVTWENYPKLWAKVQVVRPLVSEQDLFNLVHDHLGPAPAWFQRPTVQAAEEAHPGPVLQDDSLKAQCEADDGDLSAAEDEDAGVSDDAQESHGEEARETHDEDAGKPQYDKDLEAMIRQFEDSEPETMKYPAAEAMCPCMQLSGIGATLNPNRHPALPRTSRHPLMLLQSRPWTNKSA